MNIAEIIWKHQLNEVYSAVEGKNIIVGVSDDLRICTDSSSSYHANGAFFEGGECMLFPSKEERNWDRFQEAEPEYVPYEDAEEFFNDFAGAKVKRKGISEALFQYTLIVSVEEFSRQGDYYCTPKFWFYNYTTLDGKPLGKLKQ